VTACKILFFATLKDLAGIREIIVEIPEGLTVEGLKVILQGRFPSLKVALDHALVAVNREYAATTSTIPPDAEIAIFPPVSGGSASDD
jgi:molybdopterin converting factor subunit 1